MSSRASDGERGEAYRLWQSSGFAALFTLFLGALVLTFYFDDQNSISTLNAQLSLQREQRDREIISTNHDIVVLQDELRHVQSALLGNERALRSTEERLGAVMAAFEHHAPVPTAPANFEPAVEMNPEDRAAFAKNLDTIKAINASIRSNEDAFLATAKALLAIRQAIGAALPPQEAKADLNPWSLSHLREANQALDSQLKVIEDRRVGLQKDGPYVPRDLPSAMFQVQVKNAELTEVQHQLLSLQADLGAAEQALARIQKSQSPGR